MDNTTNATEADGSVSVMVQVMGPGISGTATVGLTTVSGTATGKKAMVSNAL